MGTGLVTFRRERSRLWTAWYLFLLVLVLFFCWLCEPIIFFKKKNEPKPVGYVVGFVPNCALHTTGLLLDSVYLCCLSIEKAKCWTNVKSRTKGSDEDTVQVSLIFPEHFCNSMLECALLDCKTRDCYTVTPWIPAIRNKPESHYPLCTSSARSSSCWQKRGTFKSQKIQYYLHKSAFFELKLFYLRCFADTVLRSDVWEFKQALWESPFGKVKVDVSSCHSWMRIHPGVTMKIYDLLFIVKKQNKTATTTKKTFHWLQHHPISRRALHAVEFGLLINVLLVTASFAPSQVTDCPLPVTPDSPCSCNESWHIFHCHTMCQPWAWSECVPHLDPYRELDCDPEPVPSFSAMDSI